MLDKNKAVEIGKKIVNLRVYRGIEEMKLKSITNLLEQSDLYKRAEDQRNALHQLEDNLSLLETEYKMMMVDDYRNTPEDQRVKQYPGVSISERKNYSYDESMIIPWLREKGHDELISESIDKTKVKKLADVLDVPGIETSISVSSSWKGELEVTISELINEIGE